MRKQLIILLQYSPVILQSIKVVCDKNLTQVNKQKKSYPFTQATILTIVNEELCRPKIFVGALQS